jgi:plasmid stabilization system protein ParE
MARIEPAPEGFDDFDRCFDYIAALDVGAAPARIEEILQAVRILATVHSAGDLDRRR